MPAFGTEKQFFHHFRHAKAKDLTDLTAVVYALLAWNWEILSGQEAAKILSGRRSSAHQLSLRAKWEAGDRRGLVVRPALRSKHLTGEAFDVERGPALHVWGAWIQSLGGRWGGTFRVRDPVHFDLGSLSDAE